MGPDNINTVSEKHSVAGQWARSALQVTKRAGKTVYDVLTSPAILFGAGVCVWSYQISGKVGFWANVAVTSGSLVSRAYESWTGRKKGVPYFIRAAANAVTVASTLEHGLSSGALHMPASSVAELWNPVKSVILPAISSALAGVANGLQGLHELRKTEPKGTADDPMFYVGLCDPPAVIGLHGLSAKALMPFAAGLAKSFVSKSKADKPVDNWGDLIAKHTTPARLFALGWGICTAMSKKSDPVIAVAEGCWTGAFAFWDEKPNHQFLSDLRRCVRRPLKHYAA